MPSLEELVKLFAERARRQLMEEVERQKNKDTSTAKWEGYDADGNPIVKDGDQTKTVKGIGNTGMVKGTKLILDDVGSVEYKQRQRQRQEDKKVIERKKKRVTPPSRLIARDNLISVAAAVEENIYYNTGETGREDVICIAVIDENDGGIGHNVEDDWTAWRGTYPTRPFYLFKPGTTGNLFVPANFTEDERTSFAVVARDNGVVADRSDWYALAGLTGVDRGAKVILFVDQSGSMTLATVQASFDFFQSQCIANENIVKTVTNASEDYIAPFYIDDSLFDDGISTWPS